MTAPLTDAQAAQLRERPVYECTGCGCVTRDPIKQIRLYRSAGRLSCCPERRMVELPILALLDEREGHTAALHHEQRLADGQLSDRLKAERERDALRAERDALANTARTAIARAHAAEADAARLRKALEPFDKLAGEMFARNWNASQIVTALDNLNDTNRVTAGDYFNLRSALTTKGTAE